MEKTVICYYHQPDLDGHCSAAIVRKYYNDNEPSTRFIGIDVDHSDNDIPILDIVGDVTVYVVDFSFKPEVWDNIIKAYGFDNIVWLDHHISAIVSTKDTDYANLKGTRRVGVAGCYLTWEYLFSEEVTPASVTFLSKYDVWDNSDAALWDNKILPFQYGLRLYTGTKLADDSIDWSTLLNQDDNDYESYVTKITNEGNTVLRYSRQNNARIAQSAYYECRFEGYSAVVINNGGGSAALEAVYNRVDHDIMITWRFLGGKWVIGLYSENADVDCAKIAREYGGGGHKGAAGFTLSLDENPLEIFKYE